MQVKLPVMRQDFPPHVTDVRLQQVTLFVFARMAICKKVRVKSLAQNPDSGVDTITT